MYKSVGKQVLSINISRLKPKALLLIRVGQRLGFIRQYQSNQYPMLHVENIKSTSI